ncbi:prolipoprotein diacylglyceryl transferase [Mycoplasmopsis cricetuli]|uniref:prolipoprotein diacylglyceryl transferase n=1 Tax=Mycoplasmopsis cricetuli TaxID=171283 RepID=UPI0004726EE2
MSNIPSYVPDAAIRVGTPTILFRIGNFDFRVYSFMIMLGIIASILTIVFFWKRENYKIDILLTFVVVIIPISLIGARLGYVVEALIYEDKPFEGTHWYAIWDGGLSIQGGVILGALAGMIYGWKKRDVIDYRKTLSIIIPTILIGQFVGRWGNFANHEVYGKIDWSGKSATSLGKIIADNLYISDSYTDTLGISGAYRYPLFLYEGLANLFGYLIIVWVLNLFGIFKPGTHSALYFIWYGTVRLAMEPLRQEAFSLYSNAALFFILGGAIVFIYFQFLSKVKYIRTWEKYRFVYTYEDELKYQQHVACTSFTAHACRVKEKYIQNKGVI